MGVSLALGMIDDLYTGLPEGMFPGCPLGWIASVMVCCHIGTYWRDIFFSIAARSRC
jgi:hypothetical protein